MRGVLGGGAALGHQAVGGRWAGLPGIGAVGRFGPQQLDLHAYACDAGFRQAALTDGGLQQDGREWQLADATDMENTLTDWSAHCSFQRQAHQCRGDPNEPPTYVEENDFAAPLFRSSGTFAATNRTEDRMGS